MSLSDRQQKGPVGRVKLIYLTHNVDRPLPPVAFTSAPAASAHAEQAAKLEDGRVQVDEVPLLDEPPNVTPWIELTQDRLLDGTRVAETRVESHQYMAGPVPVAGGQEAGATWELTVRDMPSQPPSRVRLSARGTDDQSCSRALADCWQRAEASAEFATARDIEGLLLEVGTATTAGTQGHRRPG